MKILMISIFPPAEVPEADHAYHQCLHLADAGHEVHVLTQDGSIVPDHPKIHVTATIKHWRWAEILPMAHFMRQSRPDAILLNYVGHAYGNRPMITFTATLAKYLLPGVPFVTQISHPSGAALAGLCHRMLNALVSWLLGQRKPSPFGTLLRDSARVVVLSSNHVAALEQQSSHVSEKVVVIPPPLIMPLASKDSDSRRAQREKLRVKDKETLFAFFGYIYRGKGVETLLRAFSLLCDHRNDVNLVFIGGGAVLAPGSEDTYVTELRQLIRDFQIEDKVRFTGGFSWDSDQASKYLRSADIAVLPFDNGVQLNNSSFAAVVTHGLPTITTQGESLEQPFIHRSNVFLCTPKDPGEMAVALEEILADADLRNRLHLGALELTQSCFSWQTATDKLVSALAPLTDRVSQAECFG